MTEAKESVKERDDDDRDQAARTHSILISICHAETTLLLSPKRADRSASVTKLEATQLVSAIEIFFNG